MHHCPRHHSRTQFVAGRSLIGIKFRHLQSRVCL